MEACSVPPAPQGRPRRGRGAAAGEAEGRAHTDLGRRSRAGRGTSAYPMLVKTYKILPVFSCTEFRSYTCVCSKRTRPPCRAEQNRRTTPIGCPSEAPSHSDSPAAGVGPRWGAAASASRQRQRTRITEVELQTWPSEDSWSPRAHLQCAAKHTSGRWAAVTSPIAPYLPYRESTYFPEPREYRSFPEEKHFR